MDTKGAWRDDHGAGPATADPRYRGPVPSVEIQVDAGGRPGDRGAVSSVYFEAFRAACRAAKERGDRYLSREDLTWHGVYEHGHHPDTLAHMKGGSRHPDTKPVD